MRTSSPSGAHAALGVIELDTLQGIKLKMMKSLPGVISVLTKKPSRCLWSLPGVHAYVPSQAAWCGHEQNTDRTSRHEYVVRALQWDLRNLHAFSSQP